jgi:hypothetical protein
MKVPWGCYAIDSADRAEEEDFLWRKVHALRSCMRLDACPGQLEGHFGSLGGNRYASLQEVKCSLL